MAFGSYYSKGNRITSPQIGNTLEFDTLQSDNDISEVLEIAEIRQVAEDCYKLVSTEGPSFFVRSSYLNLVSIDEISEGSTFGDDKADELVCAGFSCAAERYALALLNRCEQSRFGLTIKLQKKGFPSLAIKNALEYLECKKFLSDSRYAQSWARLRVRTKGESSSKIILELISRGIERNIAEESVKEVFSDINEDDLLRKAIQKYRNRGYTEEKLMKKLLYMGFSYKFIKFILNKK